MLPITATCVSAIVLGFLSVRAQQVIGRHKIERGVQSPFPMIRSIEWCLCVVGVFGDDTSRNHPGNHAGSSSSFEFKVQSLYSLVLLNSTTLSVSVDAQENNKTNFLVDSLCIGF